MLYIKRECLLGTHAMPNKSAEEDWSTQLRLYQGQVSDQQV
jgi:hypothetical protein